MAYHSTGWAVREQYSMSQYRSLATIPAEGSFLAKSCTRKCLGCAKKSAAWVQTI